MKALDRGGLAQPLDLGDVADQAFGRRSATHRPRAVGVGLDLHPHFPTTRWLTTELVGALLIVPVPVLRGLIGLTLAVAVIRSLDIFQLELDRRLTAPGGRARAPGPRAPRRDAPDDLRRRAAVTVG